jgi:cell shape-determining protein MreC
MESFEFSVIQDLQVSLQRAYEDKQALRQMLETFSEKLAAAEQVAKAANTYCESLEYEDDNSNEKIVALYQALNSWKANI